jgi:hypothetical protein
VSSVKTDGTDTQAVTPKGMGGAWDMISDGATLFWITPNCGGESFSGAYALPLDGGAFVQLATDGTCPNSLTADDTALYYATGSGYLRKVPKAGFPDAGPPATIPFVYVDNAGPHWIAWDRGLFFIGTSIGEVVRMPATGTGETVIGRGAVDGVGLKVDHGVAYWLAGTWNGELYDAGDSGALLAVPEDGGPTQTVAAGFVLPFRLAFDDRAIYWTERGTTNDKQTVRDGAIWKLAR